MAKITRQQVADQDLFGDIGKSAMSNKDKVIVLTEAMKMLIGVAKQVKEGASFVNPSSVDDLKDVNKLVEESNKLAEQRKKANDELAKSRAKLNEEDRKALKGIEKMTADLDALKRERSALNKAEKQGAINSVEASKQRARLNLEIKRTSKELNDATKRQLGFITAIDSERKKLKDLIKQKESLSISNKNTKDAEAALDAQIRKTAAGIDRAEKSTNRFKRGFTGLQTSIDGVRKRLGQLMGALGIVAGFQLFRRVVGDSFNIVRDFEKANAELAGVLNTNIEGVAKLTDNAKELGSTTAFTASQVTQLQIAYSRLGFTQEEILQLTEGTINGAIALNAGLDETAELAGAMVRTFRDFDASDTDEILDKLTVSTQRSALNFERLQKALPIVGGAAEAAGIDFDRLLALLGKLSDAGIDASTSATALRNIFIESSAQGLTYEEILKKIVDEQDKLTAANDEFGKRAAVSANVLANNIFATLELEGAISSAGGTAEEVANTQLDTLDGSIKLLQSAWEGWILRMNDSINASGFLKNAIRFLANNLDQILTVVTRAIQIFVTYKVTVVAIRTATQAYIFATNALRVAKIALSNGIGAATKSIKRFNLAMKSNIIGFFITAVITLINWLFSSTEALDENTEAVEDNTDAQLENIETIQERIRRLDELNKRIKEGAELNHINVNELQDLAKEYRKVIDETEALTKIYGINDEMLKTTGKTREDYLLSLLRETDITNEAIQQLHARGDALIDLDRLLKNIEERGREADGVSGTRRRQEDEKTRLSELKKELKENRKEVERLADENTSASDLRVQALNTEGRLLQQQIKTIEALLNLELKVEDNRERANKQRLRELAAELEAERQLIAFNPIDSGRDPSQAVFADREKVERDLQIKLRQIRLDFIEKELKDKEKALMQNFDSEGKLFEEAQALRLEKIKLENEIRATQFEGIQEDLLKEELDLQIDFLDKKLNNEFENDQAIEDAEKELQKKLIDLQIERLRNEKFLLDEESLEYKKLTEKIFALQQQRADLDKKDAEAEKMRFEQRREAIEVFTNFFVAMSDKRIEKINEEIDAAQRQADTLRALANEGNITAQQSLAQQDQIIAEAQRRREELERRKQRVLLASAVLQAYNSELAAGKPSSEAFASAITSTAVLQQFIEALPTFFEGTENVGASLGSPHLNTARDQYIVRVDKDERIVDPVNNAKIGNYSNDELAKIAEDHRAGKYIVDAKYMQASNGGQTPNKELLKEVKGMRKDIQNQPGLDISLGEVTNAYARIIETKTKGNETTQNSFIVK